MALRWSSDYVGLPWSENGNTREGLSCWGLVNLIYQERLLIDVPTYKADVVSAAEREELERLRVGAPSIWRPVERGQERPFDLVMIAIAGFDAHVGIVTKLGEMLHISEGFDSRIERYSDGQWMPRLSGIYRHEAVA